MSNPTIELKQKKETFNSTWLRTCEGFEGCPEEEAEKIIAQLRQLADIVCRHVQKGNTNEHTDEKKKATE